MAQIEGLYEVGLSALLTVTLPSMKSTIEALEAAGLRGQRHRSRSRRA